MTKRAKAVLSYVTGLPAAGAVMFFLVNTAFVSHAELRPVTNAVDSLRTARVRDSTDLRAARQDIARVLCYARAEAGEVPRGECMRPGP